MRRLLGAMLAVALTTMVGSGAHAVYPPGEGPCALTANKTSYAPNEIAVFIIKNAPVNTLVTFQLYKDGQPFGNPVQVNADPTNPETIFNDVVMGLAQINFQMPPLAGNYSMVGTCTNGTSETPTPIPPKLPPTGSDAAPIWRLGLIVGGLGIVLVAATIRRRSDAAA